MGAGEPSGLLWQSGQSQPALRPGVPACPSASNLVQCTASQLCVWRWGVRVCRDMGLNNTHSSNKCFWSLCCVPGVRGTAWGADILMGRQHI